MTDRKQALIELREKVKAGEWFPGIAQRAVGGVQNYHAAKDAFHGSLDAAKALHDAVLPGWDRIIGTHEDEDFEASVAPPLKVKTYDGLSQCMARAWLLAVLEAIIAQEGRE